TKILRSMKLTILFMFFGVLFLSAKTYSQKVSYKGQNVSLENLLKDLGQQSGYYLFYKYNDIKDVKIKNIQLNNVDLEIAVAKALEDLPFEFRLRENTIIINKVVKEKAQKTTPTSQQQRPISGTVSNAAGEVLHGATVMIKNTQTHVIADELGAFRFPDVPAGAILVVSFIGYDPQEVTVGDRTTLSITLVDQEKDL